MSAKHAPSPLAPKTTPTLPRIAGVKLAAGRSGVRYKDRDDVMLAVLPAGATVAGVLTKSKTSSAPVDWCKKNLARGKIRAIIANAGNANAFTGKLGDKAVEESTRAVAQCVGRNITSATQPVNSATRARRLPIAGNSVGSAGPGL